MGPNNKQHSYNLQNHSLSSSITEKDLGITIDKDLTFKEHIHASVSKANRMLGLIRSTFTNLTPEILLPLYKCLVRPHLEYASPVWSPHFAYLIKQLERVQRRATKLVKSIKDLTYEERLKVLRLPTLSYRRRRADLLELYKITHKLTYYTKLTDALKPALSSSTRGHPYKLQVLRTNGLRQHFFSTRTIPIWNSLAAAIVNSNTINNFKSALAKDSHELSIMFTQ